MPTKNDDMQQIITQLALLNEQFASLKKTVERSIDDHEGRIRTLESGLGLVARDIATTRERMTVFNLMQGTLTAIASSVTSWLARQ